MTYDEIDQGAKLNFKIFMTHKVCTSDGFNNAVIGSLIGFMLFGTLLGCKLRRLLIE